MGIGLEGDDRRALAEHLAGRDAVQQSVDYTVSWYLAKPSAITQTLRSIYKLEKT